MIFKFLIAANATEIAYKWKASTWFTLMRSFSLMFLMTMFAFTRWSPHFNIKAFPSWEMSKPYLFRSPGNKLKPLTITVFAIGNLFLSQFKLVLTEQMPTETSWLGSHSETIICSSITDPSDIDTTFNSFLSMFEFPLHHLGSTWSCSYLLHTLENSSCTISL